MYSWPDTRYAVSKVLFTYINSIPVIIDLTHPVTNYTKTVSTVTCQIKTLHKNVLFHVVTTLFNTFQNAKHDLQNFYIINHSQIQCYIGQWTDL